jgi:purine nucleosidase
MRRSIKPESWASVCTVRRPRRLSPPQPVQSTTPSPHANCTNHVELYIELHLQEVRSYSPQRLFVVTDHLSRRSCAAAVARKQKIIPAPRIRVILDNDFAGDPDGLFPLVHLALSPSVDLRAITASHLAPGDVFDSSNTTATDGVATAHRVLAALGVPRGTFAVLAGSNVALSDTAHPERSPAVDAIIREALRNDTTTPLYLAVGGGLTNVAAALLLEPAIADRATLIWIGGREYPGVGVVPPAASVPEYNANIDGVAAGVVFNASTIPIWQVPRAAYRLPLVSQLELEANVRPYGEIGPLLVDAVGDIQELAAGVGIPLGETYILGDSPLALLTALQSSFQPDPSSSHYVVRNAATFFPNGTDVFGGSGREIRVYDQLDTRLMFMDFFAKLQLCVTCLALCLAGGSSLAR